MKTKIKKTIYKIWFLLLVIALTLEAQLALIITWKSLIFEVEKLGLVSYVKADEKIAPQGSGEATERLRYKITCFTGVECQTTICQSGKIKIGDVAINPKLGKWNQIKIPAFEKTYQAKWISDSLTDIDIYFGNTLEDYQKCLKFGTHFEKVKFLN